MNSCELLKNIKPPSEDAIALRINSAAEREIINGSLWLYENSITRQNKPGNPGDTAVIFDKNNRFLAVGLYDPASHIRVRILAIRTPQKIDKAWFRDRLRKAMQIRKPLGWNTDGYRVIHGENDGLPGLVIDRYAKIIVIKLYSIAWIPHLPGWCELLAQDQETASIVLRLSQKVQSQSEYLYGLHDGDVIYGERFTPPVLFLENALHFRVDPVHGHKTGFYLDQRENRQRTMKFTKDASVLNVFSYSGGFSVYAAAGGARIVTSVDQNSHALKDADQNFELNRNHYPHEDCKHKIIQGDAFEMMNEFVRESKKFDVVIIDPPSFAKREDHIPAALNAYQTLTNFGINLIKNTGLVIQSSCSSKISKAQFKKSILEALHSQAINYEIILETGHPLDHPVVYPPSEYLKCIFFRVNNQ